MELNRLNSIDELNKLRESLVAVMFQPEQPRINACCGTACTASGAYKVINALKDEAQKRNLPLEIVQTGCQGMCQKGPIMKTEPSHIFYQRVKPDQASPLISYTFGSAMPYRQALYRVDILHDPLLEMVDLPFYKKQMRVALRNNDKIDPSSIHQYIAIGGYRSLQKALSSMTPDEVLDEVDKANLRGRGGAGFPAGRKWRHTKSSQEKTRFVIANGDEGDPGAFMDRSIMEADPHSLIEGMLLCAYAISARYGFIYVRHEYPLAVKHLKHAISQAEQIGLLGQNILGTDFSFSLRVREGAGAFVCGESTALIASIEGDRGFPRPRPPRLSEKGGGVWGYPTNLNNIETYACVPPIIEKGAGWFRSIGTENSPGTKVFALTGKVKNTGLVEVPMGTTLREIIFEIGGGIIGDKAFKAVQTGGPSGGCLPASYLDLPVDFDSLIKAGSMMGSGGMVVMDEDTCMVDVAKYFLSFTQSESCGKCPTCRIGTYQMLQIMEKITSGNGKHGDIEKLVRLGKMVKKGSLCGLGQSAPNPVLSTIKYFREEFEEHVYDNYCRSKVCSGTGVYVIDQNECIRCGLCKESCAYEAVKETCDTYYIEDKYCNKCKACYTACPVDAVKVKKKGVVRLQKQFAVSKGQLERLEKRAEMTLKEFLKTKPGKVLSCTLSAKVAEAATKMKDANVASVLVFDDKENLVGILTERDAMRCFAERRPMDKISVQEIMTRNPIVLNMNTDIGLAVNLMSEMMIRHLPVIENDKVVGLVYYRDLVMHLLSKESNISSEQGLLNLTNRRNDG